MGKEHADYKSIDTVAVVKVSSSVYNGKYVDTPKSIKGVSSGFKVADDFHSSLLKTIDSVDKALRESERIIPFTKNTFD